LGSENQAKHAPSAHAPNGASFRADHANRAAGPDLRRVLAARALEGRSLDRASITAAQQALAEDLDPPRDLHGPPEMKRHLARVLTERVLLGFLSPKVQAA
jgi:CO/xanthine dehydrogenase FAD-binding subunit